MRKAFLAAMALVTSMATFYTAAAGPAAAEPANADSASAYGLSATGAIPISPTITTMSSFPPGGDNNADGNFNTLSPTLLTVPVGSLVLAGAVGVIANSHTADDITPELNPTIAPDAAPTSSPVTLDPVNTRALAKTTGLGVAFTAPPGSLDAIAIALQAIPSLVSADAVTSEAVARCVDGKPVFDTGYQIAGLGGVVGDVLDPTVQALLNTLLALLPAGSTLGSVISITPGVVKPLADGVAVDGLQISIPLLLNENLVISHSEVHMAADCKVVVAAGPTGPGGVAPTGGGRLASTGTDLPFLPVGISLVALAMVGGGVVRRSRREKTVTQ